MRAQLLLLLGVGLAASCAAAEPQLALPVPAPSISGVCWASDEPPISAYATRVLLLWDPAADAQDAALEELARVLRARPWIEGIAIAAGTDFDGTLALGQRFSALGNLRLGLEDFDVVRSRWLPLAAESSLPRAYVIESGGQVVWAGSPQGIETALASGG